MLCKRQEKSPLKLDPSCFNSELFFVRTHMYFLTCVPVRIHAYQHTSRRLSNYITPNSPNVMGTYMAVTVTGGDHWIYQAITEETLVAVTDTPTCAWQPLSSNAARGKATFMALSQNHLGSRMPTEENSLA